MTKFSKPFNEQIRTFLYIKEMAYIIVAITKILLEEDIMVDFAALEQTVSGHLSSLHKWAKNIETAILGSYYTTVIENLDYYVVECAAKPALNKAPEWVSDNRAVSFIKDYKGLVIVATTVALTIFIMVMLHPKRPVDAADKDQTGKPDPIPPNKNEDTGEASPRVNGEKGDHPITDENMDPPAESKLTTPRDQNNIEESPRVVEMISLSIQILQLQ